jgi:SAM-dependent methyltransferase
MAGKSLSDGWVEGDPYDRYVGRWSRRVAPRFLSWLRIPAGSRWLDVGCGTGALSEAILDGCAPCGVVGIEPSDGFLATAKERLAGRAALLPGSAESIPLGGGTVDAVVSGLVLNFIPDRHAALAEMARVATRGGTVAAYVWDYAGKMELIRLFWDAAVELDADARVLHEGNRFPVCQPNALGELFAEAGLQQVAVTAVDVPTPFASFDDYWQPFLGGQGPAPAYVASLDPPARTRLRDRLRDRVPDGGAPPFALTARAWAVRGTVPR